jgi:hypothetical protein
MIRRKLSALHTHRILAELISFEARGFNDATEIKHSQSEKISTVVRLGF